MWKAIKSPTVWIKEKKLVAGHTSIADSPLAGESNSGSSSCSCEVATFLAMCSARICFIAYKLEFSFPVKKHRKYKDIDQQIRNFFLTKILQFSISIWSCSLKEPKKKLLVLWDESLQRRQPKHCINVLSCFALKRTKHDKTTIGLSVLVISVHYSVCM